MMGSRYFHLLCVVVLLFASMVTVASAAQEDNMVYLRSSASTVRTGENVLVTVSGKALTDVYGAEIELDYNPANLKYVGASSSLSSEAYVLQPKVNDGKILLVFTYTGQRAG